VVPGRAHSGLDAKKKTLSASERDEGARQAWQEQMAGVAATRLVFVDETGTTTRMTPTHAVAPRGQRAYGRVPRNHTRNTTLICALTLDGLQAPMVLEGAMNREALVAWISEGLAPTLAPGQIVVLDNLNVHLGTQVRAAIEACQCQLAFLPAYSPDLMPIEGAYSKVKQQVRQAAKRTQAELEAAIGQAVQAVTARDAAGWFTHCGYPPSTGPMTL